MKTEAHPKYQDVNFKCACGAVFTAGSTLSKDTFNTEICSNCHPFYTGKQKLIDASGRVDKFMEKMKKAQAHTEKNVKKVDTEDAEDVAKETAEASEEAEAPKKKASKQARLIENMDMDEDEVKEETAVEENPEEEVEVEETKE